MEAFIIRIYRREEGPDSPLAGVVELVGKGTQEAFHTLEELGDLLGIQPGPSGDEERPNRTPVR